MIKRVKGDIPSTRPKPTHVKEGHEWVVIYIKLFKGREFPFKTDSATSFRSTREELKAVLHRSCRQRPNQKNHQEGASYLYGLLLFFIKTFHGVVHALMMLIAVGLSAEIGMGMPEAIKGCKLKKQRFQNNKQIKWTMCHSMEGPKHCDLLIKNANPTEMISVQRKQKDESVKDVSCPVVEV